MNCSICERIEKIKRGEYPFFIKELKESYAVLNEHQFYPGYCVLWLKQHHREMHDLSPEVQQGLMQDLMWMTKHIHTEFKAWKMNHASYGNQCPHIHWHIIPRYESDPRHKSCPWANEAEFEAAKISEEQAKKIIQTHFLFK